MLVGSIVQATENSNLKTQESQTVVKGTKETKQPESIAGYTYVGYIHTSKNNTAPPVEKGIVTVNYQDEQGNSVAATETLEGDIGKPYQTSMKKYRGLYVERSQRRSNRDFYRKSTSRYLCLSKSVRSYCNC